MSDKRSKIDWKWILGGFLIPSIACLATIWALVPDDSPYSFNQVFLSAPNSTISVTPTPLPSPTPTDVFSTQPVSESKLTSTPSTELQPEPLDTHHDESYFDEYVVQFGDTLEIISQKFDTSIEEIIKFNNIEDQHALTVGMLLLIPVNENQSSVVIQGVIGQGDISTERIFITNNGSVPLSLKSWTISDRGEDIYTFPNVNLNEFGGINVWTGVGNTTAVDLYLMFDQAIWKPGYSIILRDSEGNIMFRYDVP